MIEDRDSPASLSLSTFGALNVSSSNNSQSTNIHERLKGIDREGAIREFQNRLVLLHHAANCPYSNMAVPKPCRGFPSCSEMVLLLRHVNNCELKECPVPHCVSTRYLLTHSRSCVKDSCIICKPLKESIRRKNERSKQVVTVLKRKREDGYASMDEVSPLSTPRYDLTPRLSTPRYESTSRLSTPRYDSTPRLDVSPRLETEMDEEERRRRRVDRVQGVTSGESESDTASQISSTIYQALASEVLAMEQSEDGLDSMNDCLNISPQLIQQHQQQQQQQQSASLRRPPIVPLLPLASIRSSYSSLPSPASPNPLSFHCFKCSATMLSGYRYFCEICNANLCTDCFHCEGSMLPHEHPVRAMKIDSFPAPLPPPPPLPSPHRFREDHRY